MSETPAPMDELMEIEIERRTATLRDRVKEFEATAAKVAEDLAQIHNNFDHADPVYAKLVKAHDELKALSPNGTEGGANE